jgi:hypothetical protein
MAEGGKRRSEPQASAVPMAVSQSVAGLMLVSQLPVVRGTIGRKLATVRPLPSCAPAGADADRVAQWVEEGRRRAQAARLPPFSQPGRTPPLLS